jgi:hypothetical protein
MSQIIPIYIPTFISDQNYNPSRVLPHLYFYNGLIDCETYWIESGSAAFGGVTYQQNAFPYFDNYNVVSGSFPTTNSESLLFNNENAAYGQIPTENLYTTYWETYVSLLYNPKTRLLNCEAIIPLADYFKMELNDVVNFKGNYYHLRAINEYSLKTGECVLQLLGPIIRDTLSDLQPIPTVQASSSVSWSFTETRTNGTFTVFDDATTLATLTANGSGSAQISQSHYVTASLAPVSYPSSGSVTMSINVNGGTTLVATGSTNTTISASFLVGAGQQYGITGSIEWNDTPSLALEYLVVAGGGGAGSQSGATSTWPGGGGAGGFKTGSITLSSSVSLPVEVGTGGAVNTNGTTSSFNSLTSTGGGAGGSGNSDPGNSGGSGGGGSTTGNSGSGVPGEGYNGVKAFYASPTNYNGGGGGGAGGGGFIGTPGSTLAWLDGNQYAGGGNGVRPDVSGSLTSGSGGNAPNSSGQNGIVIIRYAGSGSQATGGIISYSGSYTYHTFISGGTFTY